MTITYHTDLIQGSDEWLAARCGLLTASEMKLILTPTFKSANNDKERTHLYELLAQRVTKYVEPRYIGDDMLRGQEDELEARKLYAKSKSQKVIECGFITNDRFGFTLGYSPDGLIGDDGAIECKSRCQKYQVQTIIENAVPQEFVLQLQTGLLVSEREWIDFVSYCGGMPLYVCRVFPDKAIQEEILLAAGAFEMRLAEKLSIYTEQSAGLLKTERLLREMTL